MTFFDRLSNYLIDPQIGSALAEDWVVISPWVLVDRSYIFTARSKTLANKCALNESSFIDFPVIVQGVQTLSIAGQEIENSGDVSFQIAGPSYNAFKVPCSKLKGNTGEITWNVVTQTGSLATVTEAPTLRENFSSHLFFSETLNIVATVMLPTLAAMFAILFYRKVKRATYFSFLCSIALYTLFFLLLVPNEFGIHAPSLPVRQWGDVFLWCGTSCTVATLFSIGFLGRRLMYFYTSAILVSIAIILTSQTLDGSQIGSAVASITSTISMVYLLLGAIKQWGTSEAKNWLALSLLVILCFIISGINDFLFTYGLIHSEFLFPTGVVASTVLLTIHVNLQIEMTYVERDHLRANLQNEVDFKTAALKQKSEELESTLDRLKTAQAELVQNAKLASLGTLSAGIAHEINNALNYVNGAVAPLKIIIDKPTLSDNDKLKSKKLLGLMEDGLQLTSDIIVNLKKHTANSIDMTNHDVQKVIEGVVSIIRSKLLNINLTMEIEPNLEVCASHTSLSQILLNLLTNAVDATKGSSHPEIKVTAKQEGIMTLISISDNGGGVPEDIRDRIFDPFFTTKPLGQGTGLGLHIVRNEMQRHQGKVSLHVENGTSTFELRFPLKKNSEAA